MADPKNAIDTYTDEQKQALREYARTVNSEITDKEFNEWLPEGTRQVDKALKEQYNQVKKNAGNVGSEEDYIIQNRLGFINDSTNKMRTLYEEAEKYRAPAEPAQLKTKSADSTQGIAYGAQETAAAESMQSMQEFADKANEAVRNTILGAAKVFTQGLGLTIAEKGVEFVIPAITKTVVGTKQNSL
jgi:hypothetical protein